MTEYELLDVFTSFQSLMQSWITTYFSALTAYLVSAYLLGARLTRSQAVIISTCFLIFSGLCVYAMFNNSQRLLELIGEMQALNPSRQFAIKAVTNWLALAIACAGILVSLKFMWDVRHPKNG